ncbi:MAG: hypothetical protein OK457_05680 [Thaumarchaeota archaeon]|nr:hypothetical protein [Nitrososphaerota archaeon]
MSINILPVINLLSFFIQAGLELFVIIRAAQIGKALVGQIYRRRAFWIIAMGVFLFFGTLVNFPEPFNSVAGDYVLIAGLPLSHISFAFIFPVIFAFVDSTVLAALELDFFHRDTLRWKKFRKPSYLAPLVLFLGIILFAYYKSAPTWFGYVFFPTFFALFLVYGYSVVTLFVAGHRTPDKTIKKHVRLVGLTLAFITLSLLSDFRLSSTTSDLEYSILKLVNDFLAVIIPYLLYRAVMSLSPTSRIEKEIAPTTISSPRKLNTSRISIAAVILIFAILLLFIYAQYASPVETGPWVATTSYPLQAGGSYGVLAQSCVSTSGYIYCVGGTDANGNPSNQVYTSTLSTSGIGNWTTESPYLQNVSSTSCVAYSGYLYCVGGIFDTKGDDITASYFASISTLNVGPWIQTTAFPIPVDTAACVSSSGYIYCVGGTNETAGTNATSALSNSIWYAPLSPSGIGKWSHTSDYPQNLYLPVCVASGNYIYCLGGIARYASNQGGVNYGAISNTQNVVEYALLSSNGVGPWMMTTNYPIQIAFQACGVSASNIYCVGGEQSGGSTFNGVYSAPLSSSGIGTWHQTPSYPSSVTTTCVVSDSTLYCLGGYDSTLTGVVNPSNLISTDYYLPLNSLIVTNTSG